MTKDKQILLLYQTLELNIQHPDSGLISAHLCNIQCKSSGRFLQRMPVRKATQVPMLESILFSLYCT